MGSSNRREYLTATTLDQAFLDRCQDNLENGLEMVIDVQTSDGFMRISDRNKYVGNTFYEALAEIPVISRTIGDWLNPQLELSNLSLGVSNVDGRFSKYFQSGADYSGWINKTVEVKLGLRDVSATYFTIFSGVVSDVAGVQRSTGKITINAKDTFELSNVTFPRSVLTVGSFPDLDDSLIGVALPVIYGDWTTELKTVKLKPSEPASIVEMVSIIPAFPVNGKNAGVIAGTTRVQLYVSNENLSLFDSTKVYLKRSDNYYKFDTADIMNVTNNRIFEIRQDGSSGTTLIDGSLYKYASGDLFFVSVKGIDLGAYDDNPVQQCRDILERFAEVATGDFDSTWNTLRDKASPAQSAIVNIKSRVWVQESQSVIDYAISLLEQVRCEVFISRLKKYSVKALHFDAFPASPSYVVRNWDIEKDSFQPKLDDQNIWNRARALYNFDPSEKAQSRQTSIFKNSASVTQIGKEISKEIEFPNLYIATDVTSQLKEMIRIASAGLEMIEATLTPRALLLELGDFVLLDINFGATVMTNAPCMIRKMGYDAKGLRIPVTLWSFQMLKYSGYNPSYSGMTSGFDATITEEN